MRVSVNMDDPGFFSGAYAYAVYLDGKFVRDCLTADEERGLVDFLYRYNGKLLVNNGNLVPCRMYGKVKIKRVNND